MSYYGYSSRGGYKDNGQQIRYTIVRLLGILKARDEHDWTKEVNLVSWGYNPIRLDIREWNEAHTRMSKGTTLSVEEAMRLRDVLNGMDFDAWVEDQTGEKAKAEAKKKAEERALAKAAADGKMLEKAALKKRMYAG